MKRPPDCQGGHCEHLTREARMTNPPWPWVYCCQCGEVWDAPRVRDEEHPHGPYAEVRGKGIVKVQLTDSR